jgi:hypothetical protein
MRVPLPQRSSPRRRRDSQPKVDWIGIVSPDEYPEADKADCPLDQLDAAAGNRPPETHEETCKQRLDREQPCPRNHDRERQEQMRREAERKPEQSCDGHHAEARCTSQGAPVQGSGERVGHVLACCVARDTRTAREGVGTPPRTRGRSARAQRSAEVPGCPAQSPQRRSSSPRSRPSIGGQHPNKSSLSIRMDTDRQGGWV